MPQFVSFEVLTNLSILIFKRRHAPTRLYNFFFMYRSYTCDLRISKSRQYRQYTYNTTLRRIRATTAAVEKQKNITYSECVFVGLGMQHAKNMRHIVICGLLSYTVFFHIIS